MDLDLLVHVCRVMTLVMQPKLTVLKMRHFRSAVEDILKVVLV